MPTFESCEGGDGHSYPVPTVRFYGSPATGWAGLAACLDRGLPVKDLCRAWQMESGEIAGPFWQITFTSTLETTG